MSVSLLWPQLAEAVLYTPTRSISKVRLTVASDYIVDSLKSLGKDKVSFAYLAPWQEECGCNTCSPFVAEFRRPHTVRRDRQMLFVLVQFISLIMVSSWLVDVCMLHYYYIYICSSLLLHAVCIVQLKINYFSMNHYRSNLLRNAWPTPVKNILPNLYTGLKKFVSSSREQAGGP